MTGAWLVASMLAASVPVPQSSQALPPPPLIAAAPDAAPAELTPPHRRDWMFDTAMAGVSGGNATDLTFTLYALHKGHGEGNPVLQPLGRHPVGLAAAKTAMTVTTMYALVRLHEHRPRLATAIATGAAVVMLSVAAHNAGVLRGPR